MKRCIVVLTGCMGAIAFASVAVGAVTLGNAARTVNQFHFTVTGESNASYIVEVSTNLQQWQPALTNRESSVTRTVSVNLAGSQSYYRARVARSFAGALVARGVIDLKGNNIMVDSFDSTNPLFSTPAGQYDPTKRRDHGDVAAYSGLTNSLSVGNGKIYGMLLTGPGGSALIGPQGSVGSIAFVDNPVNNGRIQPGWFRDDMDPFFPDVTPPLGPAFVPAAGVIGGTNYTYVLGNDNYMLSNLAMSGSQTMFVAGRATLWVQGSISISGGSQIIISPSGSLILYAGTAAGTNTTANIGGGGIVNQTDRVSRFQYYGLRSNAVVSLGGNGTFTGTIYASNADFSLYVGGNAIFDLIGAVISKSVTIIGHVNLHYDEDLARTGPLF